VVMDADRQARFAATTQAEGVSLPVTRRLLAVFLGAAAPSVARLGRWTRAAGRAATARLQVLDEAVRPWVWQAVGDEIFCGPSRRWCSSRATPVRPWVGAWPWPTPNAAAKGVSRSPTKRTTSTPYGPRPGPPRPARPNRSADGAGGAGRAPGGRASGAALARWPARRRGRGGRRWGPWTPGRRRRLGRASARRCGCSRRTGN
jgi:hypothetical protein